MYSLNLFNLAHSLRNYYIKIKNANEKLKKMLDD